EMKLYFPQADFLVYRKNAKTYQANVYAYGGWGAETLNDTTANAGLLGAEADAEDRRYYGSAGFESILPTLGPSIYKTRVRVGKSAYLAEYDELSTWFILQYQDNPQLSQRSDLTPLVRLMYRNVLAEAGVGVSHGDWLFNLMVHF